MKTCMRGLSFSFFAAFLASAAIGSEVSSNDVARAAAAFVSEDSIGSLVLKGCSVANVLKYVVPGIHLFVELDDHGVPNQSQTHLRAYIRQCALL